ncbi:RCC1 domain-containing protein [Hymenobacter ruricola]|uniref:RCC1-like domain-containing protein n=1 Tax=Hymenobacter ruricola TaxID=2791023 RepID=A0ABS0I970_9BACT|nr:hypothetical protein [Hymenobacter ruricola]MBF9223509.1 hypothetical protein [Hymenobacter ruricola]
MKLRLLPPGGYGRISPRAVLLAGFCWLLAFASLPAAGQARPQAANKPLAPSSNMSFHNLILCQDGSLKGWGYNTYGQLGNNPGYVATPVSIPLPFQAGIVRVAVTYNSSFAILTDGTLWAWGDNSTGQLGINSSVASTTTPTQVPGLTNVVAVAGGFYHTLALCADGTVWSWGQRQDGALGTGSGGPAIVYAPQQVTALANIRSIASGDQFSMALDASGHAWTWGVDDSGELGMGFPANMPTRVWTPVQLPLSNVRQIEGCNVRAGAVLANGTVYNWGKNDFGQLGLGHTNYVNVPTQVGPGVLTNIVSVALNNVSTCAVQANGVTYVWGSNDHGSLGISSPAYAATPVPGPVFAPNTQITGQSYQFTSIEPNGTVKLWGNGPLGYTPVNTSLYGGSYTPTTPGNLCPAVPQVASFPSCGPERAYFQRSGATYVAAAHGNTTSPAEIGTFGTTTVIDASQPPYNGKVTFDGVYHVRGNVQFVNGTFVLLMNTQFYVDGTSGQLGNAPFYNSTAVDVQKATLRLYGATLQANCPDMWGGIVLTGDAKIYTEAVVSGKRTYRSVIRDATTGVYSYTPDWTISNTNEYYLTQTDFINNTTGLYDLAKGTAQPGEGVRNCSFQDGQFGIQFESVDYAPTKVFGGNYDAASFDANSFKNLQYGMLGQAGQLHIINSSFADNYFAGIYMYATAPTGGEIYHNNVVVPAVWPAALLAQLPASYPAQATGIISYSSGGDVEITANTVQGANRTPATNPVKQFGMSVSGNVQVYDGNVLRSLAEGLTVSTNDNYSNVYHYIVGNTFTDNVVGLRLTGYHLSGYPTFPVQTTLRCNTFSTTQSGGIGVWVTAGAPSSASIGSSTVPNGNRFDGIADTKRFVYDASGPSGGGSFVYYRYNSAQEELGSVSFTNPGNAIFKSDGTLSPVASATNTNISGSGACGSSPATPGVYLRPVSENQPAGEQSVATASETRLSTPYPNPANETAAFAYALPSTSPAGRVVLRDVVGHVVGAAEVAGATGEVRLPVRSLPDGFYTAALEVNGRVVASQKLTVAH